MKIIRRYTLIVFIMVLTLVTLFLLTDGIKAAAPSKPAGRPITIGMVNPLKFVYGAAAVRAATLAVEEINAAGGVNVRRVMHPFKFEAADSRDTEPGIPVSEALMVIEKLIMEKGIRLFIGGPCRSEAALASMDLFSKYKAINIIASGCSTPVLQKKIANNYDKYKYIFREAGEVGNIVREFTNIFAQVEKNYSFNKIYIIVADVEYARAGGEAMAGILEKRGWTVLGKDRYPVGSSDFSSSLINAKDKGAQILHVWIDGPEAHILAKQWHDLKVPALPIVLVNSLEHPDTWKETGGKVEYWIDSNIEAGVVYSNFNPWVERWWNAYQKRWGKEVEMHCMAVPYTSVYVLKDAIERAGTFEDTDKLVKAIEETDLKGTPQGRIRFDPMTHQVIPSDDPEEGQLGSIFQWQAGKRVLIYPPKIAIGKIQLPPWMK